MVSASRFRVSRVCSGMMLVFFCAVWAICAWARAGSTRFSSESRCCSATWLGCNGRPGICGMNVMLLCATDMKLCQIVAGKLPPVTPAVPRHRPEVVVADPHARHQGAGETEEPGVAVARTGAGLADGVGEVQSARLAVPSSTTAFIIMFMFSATLRLMTCGASARRVRANRQGRPWN